MGEPFSGAILDVDGVLVDSPHERAWRETLELLMDTRWRRIRDRTEYAPERFTPAVYQRLVSGKPRLSGARAALEHFAVPDATARAEEYSELKQRRVTELIEAGEFTAFADGLRFVVCLRAAGIRVGSASSSKNAALLLGRVEVGADTTLLDLMDADTSGREFARGKPDPEIFLATAEELGVPPERCFVVEDAVAGIQAAAAGGMASLGVARTGEADALADAGANLVVTTLDDVNAERLADGRLEVKRP